MPRNRRVSPVVLAAITAPAAALLAAGADVNSLPAARQATPVETIAHDVQAPCCMEIVAAAAALPSLSGTQPGAIPGQPVAASRWRVVPREAAPTLLPVGVAPERGLQVRTILAARSISAVFPEIHNIGGVRPDALRWHPNGLAIDVMIPDYNSAAGIALGNQIVAYTLKNAERFGLENLIWRGAIYTPNGKRGSASGHYDHVHIATTGGGYPTGGEVYLR